MSRVAFSIVGVPIYWYGVTMALAVLSGAVLSMRRERICGLPKDTTLDMALFAVPISLVCARIYYILFSWGEFQGDILQMLNVRRGGLAIYGAIIGGVATGFVYSRIKRVSFRRMADMAVPSLALGQAIGRWGNFVNQEGYGGLVTGPRFQWFPLAVFVDANQAWHYATFFYESVWCLFVCVILIVAYHRRWLRARGDTLLWYLMLYGAERAVVEGMRADSLYLGTVRVSQALSASLVMIVLLVFLIRNVHAARSANQRALHNLGFSNMRSTLLVLAPLALALAGFALYGARIIGSIPRDIILYVSILCLSTIIYRRLPQTIPELHTTEESR